MSEYRYIYRTHGLVIGSDLELPELPAAAAGSDAGPDVRIRVGRLPADMNIKATGFPCLNTADGAVLFDFPDVGRYLIEDGSTVTIEPVLPLDAIELRLWLYGMVMSIVCLQRSLMPLHASAVAFGNSVLAFCGDSGAGKSTLAAYCLRAGGKLVTDDLLVISTDAAGGAVVHMGMPRLKLWRNTLQELGHKTDDLTPDWYREEKYFLPTGQEAATATGLRLSAIYMLKVDDAASHGVMTPVAGTDAVKELVANTFLPEFLEVGDLRAAHFSNCVRLAASVPLIRLSRQRDPRWLPQTAKMLAEQSAVLAPPKPARNKGPGAGLDIVGANAR